MTSSSSSISSEFSLADVDNAIECFTLSSVPVSDEGGGETDRAGEGLPLGLSNERTLGLQS